MINPTLLAQLTRTSTGWTDAKSRVILSYRQWLRAAPEIQSMYTINMPVAKIRNQIRHEFEKKRYVTQLPTVDVLIMKSNQEYQETMNFWKQVPHVLRYFESEHTIKAPTPTNFMDSFMQGRN